jgi:hypothetical protein
VLSFFGEAMRVLSPSAGMAIFSTDAILTIEFFPGVTPCARTPLWCRFSTFGPNGTNFVHDDRFASFGEFGDYSHQLFSHAFHLPPGAYEVEIRLGPSWDAPLAFDLVKTVPFSLRRLDCTSTSFDNDGNKTSINIDDGSRLVVDAFPFFNEYAVLVLRLLELADVVDVFVLIESRSTHR